MTRDLTVEAKRRCSVTNVVSQVTKTTVVKVVLICGLPRQQFSEVFEDKELRSRLIHRALSPKSEPQPKWAKL